MSTTSSADADPGVSASREPQFKLDNAARLVVDSTARAMWDQDWTSINMNFADNVTAIVTWSETVRSAVGRDGIRQLLAGRPGPVRWRSSKYEAVHVLGDVALAAIRTGLAGGEAVQTIVLSRNTAGQWLIVHLQVAVASGGKLLAPMGWGVDR